jgi:hypothetical protein
LALEAGIRGGTALGSPTSVHEIIKIMPWCNVDYNVTTKMTTFAGVQCETKLKIYGNDALFIYARSGAELTIESENKYLDADAGFRVKVGGKFVKKKFTLYDKYISLWQLHERDFGGYDMNILEADAFRDYVIGQIQTADDKKPYTGDLTLYVKHPGGTKNSYQGTTNEDGYFAVQDVPLKKGDVVTVKVPGSPNESDGVECTIPFSKVSLFYADYYSGTAKGIVSAKLSNYEHLLKHQQTGGQVHVGFKPGGTFNNSSLNKVKNASPGLNVQKRIDQFRKNMLVYNGPVEIVTVGSTSTETTNNTRKANIPAKGFAGVKGIKMNVPSSVSKHIMARGQVNDPLGMFTVTNLDLKPFQKVSARVNIEGFVIESEPVETDGLLVSGIVTENMTSSITHNTKKVSADNSFVIISALRSSKAPHGSVNMIMGVDMKHSSVTNPSPKLPAVPEAIKPFVFFNKTVPLKPVTGNAGVAIAETGSWNSVITFRTGADLFSPWKSSGHNFEYVSYRFKGDNLGYKYYQQKCPACSSPENLSKDLMDPFGNKKANPYVSPVKVNVKTKVPAKQPKINNMNINTKKMNKSPIMH